MATTSDEVVHAAANAAYHKLYEENEYFVFDHSRDAYEMGFEDGVRWLEEQNHE